MASFVHALSGGTHIVAAAGGAQMVMLVRKRAELFTDFILREAAANGLKAVVNGSFTGVSAWSKLATVIGSSPLPASDSTPVGQVVQEGKVVSGTSSPGKFHFSQDTCGGGSFSAGAGNPAAGSCAAIGGIAPIIVGGVEYGTSNLYRKGAPPTAPLNGDVDAKSTPFLLRKSNRMFEDVQSRGGAVGKTALGFCTARQTLLILSQGHGQSGLDADGIRGVFKASGADNAVFLDCSDSATLYFDGKLLVRPSGSKNEYLTVAVGFK